MSKRDELVAASKVAQASYETAFAAAGNDPFGPGCGEAYRALGVARAALEAHDDTAVPAVAPGTRAVRHSGGRVVRTVGRKSWTEY